VDESARGGDEERVRLHQRELLRADHAAAAGIERARNRDEIGASQQVVKFDLLRAPRRNFLCAEIRIVGDRLHVQQAVAKLGDSAADIADADDADGLSPGLVADQRVAVDVALAPQRAVGFQDAFRERQKHAQRMLGDRIGVAARLVDDQHARVGTGSDVDGIETGAVGGDDQQVRRPLQEILVDMKMPRQLVARSTDLVGVRRRKDRGEDLSRALVLEPVEAHVGPALQDFGIDVVGEIFDVEDALVVDRHSWAAPPIFVASLSHAPPGKAPPRRADHVMRQPC
jgi:hypothetical protein